MEEPALKRVRITEDPELEEIDGVPDIASRILCISRQEILENRH